VELTTAPPRRPAPSTFAAAVARFVLGTDAAAIPDEDLETVHRSCVDAIGTALAGARTVHGRLAVDRAQLADPGPSTILGAGLSRDPVAAAECNATLAHADDFDDMGGYGHPSVALMPAILAVAQQRGPVSGRELTAAFTVGFEVAAALCRAGYDQYRSCFHSTPVFGVLASACASSRLLGLSEECTSHALAIAASAACGVGRNSGTMVKPLHAGLAAGGGVLAALMAEAGMTGAPDVFEAQGGFCDAFHRRTLDLAAIADGLGRPFTVARTISLKKYPCCGSNHSALDAVARLMREHRLDAGDVAEVVVHDLGETSPVLRYPRPTDGLEGRFSIRFTIAQLVRNGHLGLEQFDDAETARPDVRDAVGRVTPEVIGRWEHRQAIKQRGNPVTIVTQRGRRLHDLVPRSEMHGSPADPLGWDEVGAKFIANASLKLSRAEAETALAAWRRLPELVDVADAIATVAG
jgi:2-methylcitrate dehydratase PrpD